MSTLYAANSSVELNIEEDRRRGRDELVVAARFVLSVNCKNHTARQLGVEWDDGRDCFLVQPCEDCLAEAVAG